MPVDEGTGAGRDSRHLKIIAWLNGLPRKQVPDTLDKRRGDDGLFSTDLWRHMPDRMKDRLREAYNSRGKPGPAFADWNPEDEIGPKPREPRDNDTNGGVNYDPNNNGGGRNRRGGGGNGGGGGGKGPGLSREELAAEYGWSIAFLRRNDELWDLFKQAVKHTWTPERFVASLRDTDWFKNHSASERQFLVNKVVDPETFQNDLDKHVAHVQQVYGSLFGSKLGPGLANKWARRAMKFGWSEEEIQDHLVESVNVMKMFRKRNVGGTAAQARDQIQQAAAAYGVDLNRKFVANNVEQILDGTDTIDGALARLKERAISKYSAFAEQIRGGRTVAEIADPYIQTMAQLLELNPEQVKIGNRKIQHALTRKVEGKERPMSLSEFEDHVRHDKRWMFTDQAKEQFSVAAEGLLQEWGLM